MSDLVEKNTFTRGVTSDLGACSVTTPMRPEVSRTSEPTG